VAARVTARPQCEKGAERACGKRRWVAERGGDKAGDGPAHGNADIEEGGVGPERCAAACRGHLLHGLDAERWKHQRKAGTRQDRAGEGDRRMRGEPQHDLTRAFHDERSGRDARAAEAIRPAAENQSGRNISRAERREREACGGPSLGLEIERGETGERAEADGRERETGADRRDAGSNTKKRQPFASDRRGGGNENRRGSRESCGVVASETAVNPATTPCSFISAMPIGAPAAMAPYRPMPTQTMTLPVCWPPTAAMPQASAPVITRLSPDKARPARMTPSAACGSSAFDYDTR